MGYMEILFNIPKPIFYLLKGDSRVLGATQFPVEPGSSPVNAGQGNVGA